MYLSYETNRDAQIFIESQKSKTSQTNLRFCVLENDTLQAYSSVARGGGGGSSPPHWLVKYAKSHVFCAFEADFLRKMENRPPFENSPPSNVWICEIGRRHHSQFWWRPFFFGDHLILGEKFRNSAEKSLSILVKIFFFFFFFFFWRSPDFGRKISKCGRKVTLNFGEDLFFLEITCFWAEKSFEFPSFPRNSSQFSYKPFKTASRSMKIPVKIVCTLLAISK